MNQQDSQRKTSVLFICHGNICRSPMAEFIFKEMIGRKKTVHEYRVQSAATSSEELGNPVYPPARRILAAHGIDCSGKRARRITGEDYRNFDFFVAMDDFNLAGLRRFYNGDPDGKFSRILDWTGRPGEVEDPWYTGDFQTVWNQIRSGCAALLEKLENMPPRRPRP